ncbi:uncharacterized protein LOC134835540 [Culicoides brevitarsis]|uniref:uncharacterized protein LOC134835540 n=1 Tax=Culicoides brevitarsis TaxID=469753 RepID=UPI00307C478E
MNSKLFVLLCVLCAVAAVPVPADEQLKSIELLKIPLKGDKELDILTLGDEGTIKERNKRTIGVLRELFPELSKMIEKKIQGIVSVLFRTIGPILLRGGAGGGAAGPTTTSSLDDDFSDEDDDDTSSSSSSSTTSGGRKVNVQLPTFAPFDDSAEDASDDSKVTTSSDAPSKVNLLDGSNASGGGYNYDAKSVTSDDDFNLVRKRLFDIHKKQVIANEGNEEESQGEADAAGSQIDLIRVVRETAAAENAIDSKPEASENTDQKASESKSPAIDDLTLDSAEDEEKNHDKRFLDFNGGGSSGGSGGSGNFLFDIIRRTADRSARFAGRVYRVVAGTESLDDNLPSSSDQLDDKTARTARTNSNAELSLLVSGSSGTEKTDEEENAPDDDSDSETGKSGDGYTEGIPGPVTRLFVLANRGLSNLIQDLILRVAQTSERLVNFKARLITSLI